jgi:cyclopropane fatty-acyl-phospholipid synthase-like methyltransferase
MTTSVTPHPWETAWRKGTWKEAVSPLPQVAEFGARLKRTKASTVLDLGAGGGRHSLMLAQEGFQVVALDVSDTALRLLDRRAKRMGLRNLVAVRHEMKDLPFVDGYFDAVLSTNVIHHGSRADIRQVLSEVRRVLRAGGRALLVVISANDFRVGDGRALEPGTRVFTDGEEEGITHHFFTEAELRSMLSGFRILAIEEKQTPVAGGARAHFYAEVAKR